jgi:hypothetical protein
MERQLIAPIVVEYGGNDADLHLLDAVQAGESIAGTAKLYNSVLHSYFVGEVPHRQTGALVRTYTHAPSPGTVDITLLVAAIYGQMAAYPEVLKHCGEFLFSKLLAAIFAKRTGRHSEMMKALEIIQEQGQQNADLAKTAIGAISRDKEQLYGLIDKLVDKNRTAMAEMVAPVGTSCRTITHFAHTDQTQVIDEPIAEVMRSTENDVIGETTEYEGTIWGVDKSTGQCRVRLAGTDSEIRGKITDPLLRTPHNVYTEALNEGSRVRITAKPIIRGDEIAKLYISDAQLKGDRH